MALTKIQRKALLAVRAKLDPTCDQFAGSDEIAELFGGKEMFSPGRQYLQSWVLPLLDALLDGSPARVIHDYIGFSDGGEITFGVIRQAREQHRSIDPERVRNATRKATRAPETAAQRSRRFINELES